MMLTFADFISELNEDFLCYCSQSLKSCGLSAAQVSFLIYIGDHPNCSPTEMAKSIEADSGYTTRTVKKLESCNMVVREGDQRDRRACMLRLTDEGMAKLYEIRALHRAWEAEKLCELDSEERELFLRVLSKLVATL